MHYFTWSDDSQATSLFGVVTGIHACRCFRRCKARSVSAAMLCASGAEPVTKGSSFVFCCIHAVCCVALHLQADNCMKLAARGAAVLSQQAPAFRCYNDSGASSSSYSSQHLVQLIKQVRALIIAGTSIQAIQWQQCHG